MDAVVIVLDVLITISLLASLLYLIKELLYHKEETRAEMKVGGWVKTIKIIVIANILLFLDMFGIGSYGPHMVCWKILKVSRDEWLPGSLNVSMLVATLVETLYLVNTIDVEMMTLIPCIIASTIGSFFGAGVVAKLNVDKIRLAIGISLIVVGIVLILGLTGALDFEGGDAHGLSGWKLIVIVAISLLFGALMTIGIGIYAPLLACATLLGMDPTYALPIMLGTCAFLIPVAAIRFTKESMVADRPRYDRKIAVIENATGWIGPVIAANVILSLPISAMKWIVVVVLFIVAAMMLYQWHNKSVDKLAEAEDAELARIKGQAPPSE